MNRSIRQQHVDLLRSIKFDRTSDRVDRIDTGFVLDLADALRMTQVEKVMFEPSKGLSGTELLERVAYYKFTHTGVA